MQFKSCNEMQCKALHDYLHTCITLLPENDYMHVCMHAYCVMCLHACTVMQCKKPTTASPVLKDQVVM